MALLATLAAPTLVRLKLGLRTTYKYSRPLVRFGLRGLACNSIMTCGRPISQPLADLWDCAHRSEFCAPEWRNWQTRATQNRVPARACGFDPLLRHVVSSPDTQPQYPALPALPPQDIEFISNNKPRQAKAHLN